MLRQLMHPLVGALFAVVLLVDAMCHSAWSQDSTPPNGQEAGEQLKLTHVTLYASGMGWFLYEGKVAPDATPSWSVRESEVSDVLRTLNVSDPAGAWSMRIDAGKDPVHRPPALPDTRTLGDLLVSMKGEPVRVETRLQAVREGRLVAVEMRPEVVGELVVERESLSILTDEGLETIALADVAKLAPQREPFRDLLSESLDRQRPDTGEATRTLRVAFAGKETRAVSVAMLRPVPMWKSTYRMYNGQFYHRGILENTSETDWCGISVALVDGTPVTFDIDLGRVARARREQLPVPTSRPEVPSPFAASMLPPTDDQPAPAGRGMGLGGGAMGGMGGGGMGGGMGGMGAGMAGGEDIFGSSGGDPFDDDRSRGVQQRRQQASQSDRGFAIRHSARDARAEPGKAGEALQILFRDVTVPSGQAVVLDAQPFDVRSRLVSVFETTSDDRTPLLSLELKNASNMRLPAGPLSVFLERTGYAGDAMLPLLSPGAERLVGFAVDDGVRVSPQPTVVHEELLEVRVDRERRMVMTTRRKTKEESFVVDNRSGAARDVLIEHPGPGQGFAWSDESPEGEPTEEGWRFSLQVPHDQRQTLELTSLDDEQTAESFASVALRTVRRWLDEEDLLDEEERQILAELVARREEKTQVLDQLDDRTNRRKELLAEIDRVTGQLTGGETALPPALAERYQNQLLDLETEREEIDAEIRTLRDEAETLERWLQSSEASQSKAGAVGKKDDRDNPFSE